MATDDERREVAAWLRCAAEQGQPYTEPTLACFIGADLVDIWTCLADLIDPDCDEGRYEGVHTARPVEREALLAEAKEAEKSAWYFALDHDENELRDRLAEAAEDFSDMARRIREACGEVGA